ncbi:MAG: FAD-dependent oxidoreductase [Bacteroidales bacterium]
MNKRPHIVVLGSNFGGLTTARLLRKKVQDAADITVIDQKSYLLFIPNIPETVMANRNPQDDQFMQFLPFYKRDKTRFIQAHITGIDPESRTVCFTPNERPGQAPEKLTYDYLVISVGCRLAYDKIEGFSEYGTTISDCFYANRFRDYLWNGHYKGGPIAIGSARFEQGTTARPEWLPTLLAACEGPVMEMAMLLATWLRENRQQKDASAIHMFTPGKVLGEDAGPELADRFAKLAESMGESILYETDNVKRITKDGIEFTSGKSLEAEIKMVFPNWEPHAFLKNMPFSDDAGFVITDTYMRNPTYKNIFAVGDCAALTVPKLGAIGDAQARVAAARIAADLGIVPEKECAEFKPMVICWGTMGDDKAFYLHSNIFYGGDVGYLKTGHLYYMMKMAFRTAYFETGGTPPPWGLPMAEWVGDKM